jgi:hypothetical protein
VKNTIVAMARDLEHVEADRRRFTRYLYQDYGYLAAFRDMGGASMAFLDAMHERCTKWLDALQPHVSEPRPPDAFAPTIRVLAQGAQHAWALIGPSAATAAAEEGTSGQKKDVESSDLTAATPEDAADVDLEVAIILGSLVNVANARSFTTEVREQMAIVRMSRDNVRQKIKTMLTLLLAQKERGAEHALLDEASDEIRRHQAGFRDLGRTLQSLKKVQQEVLLFLQKWGDEEDDDDDDSGEDGDVMQRIPLLLDRKYEHVLKTHHDVNLVFPHALAIPHGVLSVGSPADPFCGFAGTTATVRDDIADAVLDVRRSDSDVHHIVSYVTGMTVPVELACFGIPAPLISAYHLHQKKPRTPRQLSSPPPPCSWTLAVKPQGVAWGAVGAHIGPAPELDTDCAATLLLDRFLFWYQRGCLTCRSVCPPSVDNSHGADWGKTHFALVGWRTGDDDDDDEDKDEPLPFYRILCNTRWCVLLSQVGHVAVIPIAVDMEHDVVRLDVGYSRVQAMFNEHGEVRPDVGPTRVVSMFIAPLCTCIAFDDTCDCVFYGGAPGTPKSTGPPVDGTTRPTAWQTCGAAAATECDEDEDAVMHTMKRDYLYVGTKNGFVHELYLGAGAEDAVLWTNSWCTYKPSRALYSVVKHHRQLIATDLDGITVFSLWPCGTDAGTVPGGPPPPGPNDIVEHGLGLMHSVVAWGRLIIAHRRLDDNVFVIDALSQGDGAAAAAADAEQETPMVAYHGCSLKPAPSDAACQVRLDVPTQGYRSMAFDGETLSVLFPDLSAAQITISHTPPPPPLPP